MAQGAQIIWSKKALTLLSEAAAFLADLVGDQKANAFQIALVNYVDNLLSPFPEGCPPCRFPKLRAAGCRCCVYKKKYIVVYRYVSGIVKIIGVLGAHRNPKIFEDLV
jgi:plasmid stabilization system protein ParE